MTNPEETKRIVDACVGKMKNKLVERPADEIDQLIKLKEHAKSQVREWLRPMIGYLMDLPSTNPSSPHCEVGRMKLIMQSQKLYIDHFRQLSKEEVLFLLAFAYAERTLEEFV